MNKSYKLFEQARHFIPGGVNSPVRAFNAVGGNPLVAKQALGSHIISLDDKEYIDYVGSWGTAILGHTPKTIVSAVNQALNKGLSFGALTELEVLLAQKICGLIDSIEMIRMVNSGTEATMSAVRLARGFTGRDLIVKFDGCYHGHSDTLLSGAGSGVATLGISSSPGVPQAIAEQTIVLDYNDAQQVSDVFDKFPDSIAGVIVEPIAGNMNLVAGHPEFLACLRKCCSDNGALLIFDEVMSGFRVALGGAQELYQIRPDLTTLGKIIGGGLPVGAFGGRRDVMEYLAPEGKVYQAGTLSGNPLAMTAGLKTLEILESNAVIEQIEKNTAILMRGLREQAQSAGVPFFCHHRGAMFGIFFSAQEVTSFAQAKNCNGDHFQQFFHKMFENGIYFAPSPYEAGFMSIAHTSEDIEKTIASSADAFQSLTA